MLYRVVPKLFYDRVEDGLDLFVDGLEFALLFRDEDMAVVGRDGAKLMLVADPALAAKDRPEIAIETDAIDSLHAAFKARRPDLLHPNLAAVKRRPWGAREFVAPDRTQVCVVFREWPAAGGTAMSTPSDDHTAEA